MVIFISKQYAATKEIILVIHEKSMYYNTYTIPAACEQVLSINIRYINV